MSEYLPKHYLIASLELDGVRFKVTYKPVTINQSETSTSKVYLTSPYDTSEEAFIHAMGWVDCMQVFVNVGEIPNNNEDFYKSKYEELLETLENRLVERDIKMSKITKAKRELAYQEGWESKIEELNNTQVINLE